MRKYKRMKEVSRDLVWMAKTWAISLNVPMIDNFPAVGKIDLEGWDLFIPIACVWIANTQLYNEDISAKKRKRYGTGLLSR